MTQIGSSTEIKSLLNQANSMLGQLNIDSETSTYINSVWSTGNSIEQIASGDDNQKAAGIQQIINNVMSLVEKFTTGEAKAAKAEDKKNKAAAQKVVDDQQNAKTELETEIGNINSTIEAQLSTVSSEVENLTKLGEDLTEKQQEIQAIKEEIETKKAELESAATVEEKKAILEEIKGLSGQIAEILASLSDLSSQMEASAEVVENAQGSIETAYSEVQKVQKDGTQKIAEIGQQGAKQVQNNTQVAATGAQNKIYAQAAKAAAETASGASFISFGATSSAAAKFNQIAIDQDSAAGTRIPGSVSNMSTVLQGIGGLQENLSVLTNFGNSIGNQFSDFSSVVGQWNSLSSQFIASIGSMELVQTGVDELRNTVDEDLAILENSESSEGNAELKTSQFSTDDLIKVEA